MTRAEMEAIKPITLEMKDSGKEYTLEFNRKTATIVEEHGCTPSAISDGAYSKFYDFFYCAFLMHHPTIRHDVTDAVIDGWGGVMRAVNNHPDVFQRLIQLYNLTYDALCDEDVAEREENPTVTVKM